MKNTNLTQDEIDGLFLKFRKEDEDWTDKFFKRRMR